MQQKKFEKESSPTNLELSSIINRIRDSKGGGNHKFGLSESEIIGLCLEAKNIIIKQPMLLEINPPINVCGDFHGQFKDLKQVFSCVGYPQPGTHYLFLGDYVDRGKQSLECICLLLAYKIMYPGLVFLLRGNHECSELNKVYGFYDQCKRRVSIKIWKAFCDCFNSFPIAAVVGERIFCVHGGISPGMYNSLSIINEIKRPTDLVKHTVMCDILWSDPSTNQGWQQNVERGISYTYGVDVIANFVEKHDLDMICRSHQVVEDGFQFIAKRKLITIFSAPNYCTYFQNKGAVLIIEKDMKCHIKQFLNDLKDCRGQMRAKRENTPLPRSPAPQNDKENNHRNKRESQNICIKGNLVSVRSPKKIFSLNYNL